MEPVDIRGYRDDDAAATARVFFDAVRTGAQGHYDHAQRRAWAPGIPETSAWQARLAPQTVFVAECAGRVIGFMTLTEDGRIDLAYVAPGHMGQGVAGALYHAIVERALALGLAGLRTDASHLARRFFLRRGWSVVRRQTVSRNGVDLTNFAMEKRLG